MPLDALGEATLAELFARLPNFKIAPQHISILNHTANISKTMLLRLQQQWPHATITTSVLNAETTVALPSASIDLLLVNLLLRHSLLLMLQEWQRLLKPNGLLLFAALGGNTSVELAASEFSELCHDFVGLDILTLGDTLTEANFIDLVLDKDTWSLQYPDSPISIPIEILFGHAIAPMQYGYGRDLDSGDISIPIKELRRRLLR